MFPMLLVPPREASVGGLICPRRCMTSQSQEIELGARVRACLACHHQNVGHVGAANAAGAPLTLGAPARVYRYMIYALRKSGRLGMYRAGPFVDTTGGDN